MFVKAIATLSYVLTIVSVVSADHTFVFKNQCSSNITPKIVNTNCGYSPRCSTPGSGGVPNPAISYTGAQPKTLAKGQSQSMKVNRQWNGRIFAQNGKCGASGESCTLGEFNLDTGSQFTAQAYDISNIQGFTQSISIAVSGCDTVTCKASNCGCKSAYPPGDLSGCGNDSPVRGCSAGDKTWTITFCP
ncbi:hypothetical protein D9613_007844 [Agrocybe pediades]|uniref:Thaumatin-like protein n=1 Tax=Agrocybe pediades TaxID=84607 RepID=A0A8H4VKF6_9AGAR|nr:hypothetical protein D9613_007844 [Agrocybe pediades]